jgi:hypothetical protein
VWWRHTRGIHGEKARLKAVGARARTLNMPYMVVTPDVSQPEMSALKFVKEEKSQPMSVMAETSQSAMGPHVAVAAFGLALNSWSAVCREALVVKTQGGEGEGGGGGENSSGEGEGDGGLGDGGGTGQAVWQTYFRAP